MTYPKIETLFERNDDFAVDPSRFRRPEFSLINSWVVTEKIDGTNVRLLFTRTEDKVVSRIRRRSDNASFHPDLLSALEKTVAAVQDDVLVIMLEHGLTEYGLYGEGYGAKIQNGGGYRQDPGFILFDVKAGDSWLDVGQVNQTANVLHLLRVPVRAYEGKIEDVVYDVRRGFRSVVAVDSGMFAEGVVARTAVPLYDRRGARVMWKLKTKDFVAGKR